MLRRRDHHGGGIGKEVVPEGLRVLRAAAEAHGIALETTELDWSSAEYYLEHGTMLPEGWFEELATFDAIFFGAVGWPEVVPDHVSLWGSLLRFRRDFDQYVNLRPVRLLPGVPSPLAGREPGDADFLVVRENTEGEYSSIGGRMFEGAERETVIQETVMTRTGVDRVLRYAFELAASRPAHHLTSATKSNGIAITMPFWDERVAAMSEEFPGVDVDKYHIDILTANFVLHPDRIDVVVASNLFGDILSDLGPACTGTIGIAPSANINPDGRFPSLFEPVHGSAPDIAGKGIADPIGQIWSGALMLRHLGEAEAAASIEAAFEAVLAEHDPAVLTPDLGGHGTTSGLGEAIAQRVAVVAKDDAARDWLPGGPRFLGRSRAGGSAPAQTRRPSPLIRVVAPLESTSWRRAGSTPGGTSSGNRTMMRWRVPISSPSTRRPHRPRRAESWGSPSTSSRSSAAANSPKRSEARASRSVARGPSGMRPASAMQKSVSSPMPR